MKKVLYICPSSGIGGAETFLKQTHRYSNKGQYENHYLLFREGPLYQWLNDNKARTHLLATPPKLSSKSSRQAVSAEIKKLINEHNFHLVHSTMAYGALFAARMCKEMDTPHVWFQHGPASGWMDRMAAVLHHNGLIVNSHYTGKKQRQLENPIRFFIPRKNPIEKILLGTDESTHTPLEHQQYKEGLKQQFHIEENEVVIGMLCRIQEWKGVHLLIEAVQNLLKDSQIPPFKVIIWGEAFKGHCYKDNLESQVIKEGLPIIFAGLTKQPSLSLASCEIVVNASIQPEPFGLSIIEGMMTGCIPVVPNEGGPLEIVHHGKDGLQFKARSSTSLAQQLKTLLVDQQLRSKLSNEAKEVAHQKYNAPRAIAHLEQFHSKIIDQK